MIRTTYKGFNILARSYQLHESKRWTADLEIRRNGRRQPFSVAERYQTEQEADDRSYGLGRRIIDGDVAGWSVNHLRAPSRRRSRFAPIWKEGSMRAYIIAGIVLLGLGAFVLLRGGSFTTRRDVVRMGDMKITADQQQSIPPWVGGAALVAGLALIVVGTRKRA
ncbi:MAG: hypothetical protein H6R40_1315 [Gemmatimonadetes bacterium]|nr:hypothetical protein [Gemmatimonadota bacterium]